MECWWKAIKICPCPCVNVCGTDTQISVLQMSRSSVIECAHKINRAVIYQRKWHLTTHFSCCLSPHLAILHTSLSSSISLLCLSFLSISLRWMLLSSPPVLHPVIQFSSLFDQTLISSGQSISAQFQPIHVVSLSTTCWAPVAQEGESVVHWACDWWFQLWLHVSSCQSVLMQDTEPQIAPDGLLLHSSSTAIGDRTRQANCKWLWCVHIIWEQQLPVYIWC